MMRIVRSNPPTVATPTANYSHAVRVETAETVWIHVSGQIANDRDGNLVGPGDVRAQTEQVFENLAAILTSNGASFDDVVKISTFVTSFEDLGGIRDVRGRYLPQEPPASTAVQVMGLVVPEAMIEVDLVAAITA